MRSVSHFKDAPIFSVDHSASWDSKTRTSCTLSQSCKVDFRVWRSSPGYRKPRREAPAGEIKEVRQNVSSRRIHFQRNNLIYSKCRQYPTEKGERYFDEARFITATFDASPKLLNDVERLLRADEGVLRFYTTRTRNNVSKVRGESFRNRYLTVLPDLSSSSA